VPSLAALRLASDEAVAVEVFAQAMRTTQIVTPVVFG
jgi:hypothetical protein